MKKKESRNFYYIDWLAIGYLGDSNIPNLIYIERGKRPEEGPNQYYLEYIDVLTNNSLGYFESATRFMEFPYLDRIRDIQLIDKKLYFTEEEINFEYVLRERILELNNQIVVDQLENIKTKKFA